MDYCIWCGEPILPEDEWRFVSITYWDEQAGCWVEVPNYVIHIVCWYEFRAAFGGASQSVFGASGSGNFLTKTTSWLMVAFFIVNLVLVYLGVKQNEVNQLAVEPVVEAVEEVVVPEAGAEDLE